MTDRPERLLARPEPPPNALAARDPLSDVLRTVSLRGAVFFMLDMSAPWGAGMPDGEQLAPIVIPQAQQVISFHVIASGVCWGGLLGGQPQRFEAGDVVVFPRGDGYYFTSENRGPYAPDAERAFAFMRGMTGGRLPFVLKDGGGGAEHVAVICGFLGCDLRPFNPVLGTLPRLLHVKGAARAREDRAARACACASPSSCSSRSSAGTWPASRPRKRAGWPACTTSTWAAR
jgi:hypothetical protein